MVKINKLKKEKKYNLKWGQARRLGIKRKTWIRSVKWHNTYTKNQISKQEKSRKLKIQQIQKTKIERENIILVKVSYQASYRSKKNRLDLNVNTITVLLNKNIYNNIIEQIKEGVRSSTMEDLNTVLISNLIGNETWYEDFRGLEVEDISNMNISNEVFNEINNKGYHIVEKDIDVTLTNKSNQKFGYTKSLWSYL